MTVPLPASPSSSSRSSTSSHSSLPSPHPEDRALFVSPHHNEPQVLPSSQMFNHLLQVAFLNPHSIAIKDAAGEKSYVQLLTDVVAVKNEILQRLGDKTPAEIMGRAVLVLATPGYEYVVAMLAVGAVGGAAVPIGKLSSLEYKVPMLTHFSFLHPSRRSTLVHHHHLLSSSSSHTHSNPTRNLHRHRCPSTLLHHSHSPAFPTFTLPFPLPNITRFRRL